MSYVMFGETTGRRVGGLHRHGGDFDYSKAIEIPIGISNSLYVPACCCFRSTFLFAMYRAIAVRRRIDATSP